MISKLFVCALVVVSSNVVFAESYTCLASGMVRAAKSNSTPIQVAGNGSTVEAATKNALRNCSAVANSCTLVRCK